MPVGQYIAFSIALFVEDFIVSSRSFVVSYRCSVFIAVVFFLMLLVFCLLVCLFCFFFPVTTALVISWACILTRLLLLGFKHGV